MIFSPKHDNEALGCLFLFAETCQLFFETYFFVENYFICRRYFISLCLSLSLSVTHTQTLNTFIRSLFLAYYLSIILSLALYVCVPFILSFSFLLSLLFHTLGLVLSSSHSLFSYVLSLSLSLGECIATFDSPTSVSEDLIYEAISAANVSSQTKYLLHFS